MRRNLEYSEDLISGFEKEALARFSSFYGSSKVSSALKLISRRLDSSKINRFKMLYKRASKLKDRSLGGIFEIVTLEQKISEDTIESLEIFGQLWLRGQRASFIDDIDDGLEESEIDVEP